MHIFLCHYAIRFIFPPSIFMSLFNGKTNRVCLKWSATPATDDCTYDADVGRIQSKNQREWEGRRASYQKLIYVLME